MHSKVHVVLSEGRELGYADLHVYFPFPRQMNYGMNALS